MDRILGTPRRSLGTLAVLSFLILLISTAAFCAGFTGYAFGSLEGANVNGMPLEVGHFANHSSVFCGDDPSASWPFGTVIVTTAAIPIPDADDDVQFESVFTLKDIGDFDCLKSDYWVDIYFGRWTPTPAICECNNDPLNENCDPGVTNSCDNALEFGNPDRTYNLLQLPPCC